mgnify:CR=1 FL=1
MSTEKPYTYECSWSAMHECNNDFSIHLDIFSENERSDFLMNMATREKIEWSDGVLQWEEKAGFFICYDPNAWSSRKYDSLSIFFYCKKQYVDEDILAAMQLQIAKIYPLILDDIFESQDYPKQFYRRWREELNVILNVADYPMTKKTARVGHTYWGSEKVRFGLGEIEK